MVIRSTFLIAICVGTVLSQPANQQPLSGIFGRVVNAQTHQPVRRAVIKVSRSKEEWYAFTDADGRFRFPTLAQDEYNLIAHRDGYTDRSYIVERSDFEQQKELPVELYPQGVITGRVADSFGQALQGARIEALLSRPSKIGNPVSGSAETNDLGEYRLSGLDPGSYRVRAEYRDGRRSEFDATPLTVANSYYGDSRQPAEITIGAASFVKGIDFILNAARPAKVRGTLRSQTGVSIGRATVSLMRQAGSGGSNSTGKDGKFEIADVSPGAYTIFADTDGTDRLFGAANIEVRGEDVDGVDIFLTPVPKLEAEVQMEAGASEAVRPSRIFFARIGNFLGNPIQAGEPDKDGRFTIALIPGDYALALLDSASSLQIRKVTLGGKASVIPTLHVDESPNPKKLVIVVGPNTQP